MRQELGGFGKTEPPPPGVLGLGGLKRTLAYGQDRESTG